MSRQARSSRQPGLLFWRQSCSCTPRLVYSETIEKPQNQLAFSKQERRFRVTLTND